MEFHILYRSACGEGVREMLEWGLCAGVCIVQKCA